LSNPDTVPPVTAELLSWLERTFPDRVPTGFKTPEEGLFTLMVATGQQQVIKRLRQAHQHQHAQALTGTTL
jgi:hypothetical protein